MRRRQPDIGCLLHDVARQQLDKQLPLALIALQIDRVHAFVVFGVGVLRRVPDLLGDETLADAGGRIGVAIEHHVAGGIGLGGHGREEGTVFHWLDFHLHADLFQVSCNQRNQIHVVGVAGAHLHLEAEAFCKPGLGQQCLGLLGVVDEQFLRRDRHLVEWLEIAGVVRVHWVPEQVGVAVVIRLDDLLLVHRHVQRAPHADVVERFGIHAHRHEGATKLHTLPPFERGGVLLQLIHRAPADGLQHIELGGTQGGQKARLVLDGAVDDLVDKRQFEGLAANGFLIPVVRILAERHCIALHEVAELVRPGAVGVLPVASASIGHFLRNDGRVIAPAEAVIPFGVVVLEIEHHGVFVRRLDLFDVVKIIRHLLRALVEPVEAVHHVVGHQLTRLHDAGLVGEHHALAQLHLHAQRAFLPLPALGKFAADGV